jgi:hypothetical protein
MLHQQARSQQLLARAVVRIKQAKPPADEIALEVRTSLPLRPMASLAYSPDLDSLP